VMMRMVTLTGSGRLWERSDEARREHPSELIVKGRVTDKERSE
jgi:hypothetical protein